MEETVKKQIDELIAYCDGITENRQSVIDEINKYYEEKNDNYRVDETSIYPYLFGMAISVLKGVKVINKWG